MALVVVVVVVVAVPVLALRRELLGRGVREMVMVRTGSRRWVGPGGSCARARRGPRAGRPRALRGHIFLPLFARKEPHPPSVLLRKAEIGTWSEIP